MGIKNLKKLIKKHAPDAISDKPSLYNKKIARVANDIYIQSVKSEIKEAKSGDLVFFKINSKTVSHIGVYIKDDFFVHASSSRGVMISNLDEAYYRKYFFCVGKIK